MGCREKPGADHPDPGGDVVPLTVPVQHLDGVKLHVIWQAAEQLEAAEA